MIWVFLILFAIPWIQILAIKIWKDKSVVFKNKWLLYLILWLLWTPLFFTVSKSLIHPYIMPVMVPIALLITHYWNEIKHKKRIIGVGLIFPILALLLYISMSFTNKKDFYMNSDKYFIEKYMNDSLPIYHWQNKSYSGQFYSKGKIKALEDNIKLEEQLLSEKPFLIIIPHKKIKNIDKNSMNLLEEIDTNYKKSIYKVSK